MTASTIMIQGTASDAGKSILATALCRIFHQDGYSVAPFKSQNMSSYFYTTAKGEQMSIAQAIQAQAAGIAPGVTMNPILLKPTGQSRSQVVVLGQVRDQYSARSYHGDLVKELWPVAETALNNLRHQYDIVVIEGAGSPAEVNLQANEIVNMRVAHAADAPVILVADVDRGGALASVVGTLELLDSRDKKCVQGIIINKFRGDVTLFQPAVDFLEHKTGLPVLGVLPFLMDLQIDAEDSLSAAKKHNAVGEATGSDQREQKLAFKQQQFDLLAGYTRRHINIPLIYELMGIRP